MKTMIQRSALLALMMTIPGGAQAQEGFTLDTLTMETRSGSELGSSSSKGKMAEFFKAQKQAVYHILSQVGIAEEDLPPGVRRSINRPQTTSFQALVAFSSGLDALDSEQFDQAKVFFDQATRMDPGFGLAETLRDAMPEPGQQNLQTMTRTSVNNAQAKATVAVKGGTSGKAGSGGGAADAALATGGGEAGGGEVGGEAIAALEESGAIGSAVEAIEKVEQVAIDANKKENLIENVDSNETVNELTSTTTFDSLGLYATHLLYAQSETWAQVLGPYITKTPINLNSTDNITISETGSGSNALTVSPSSTSPNGNMSNYDRHLSGATINGVAQSGLNSQFTRTTSNCFNSGSCTVSSSGTTGSDTYLEIGYYNFTGWSATCTEGSGTCNYQSDRIYFAEGVATSTEELSTLASQENSVFNYTGHAIGDITYLNGSSSQTQNGTGNFSTTIDFNNGRVSDLNLSLQTSSYQFNVDGGSGTIQNGRFTLDHNNMNFGGGATAATSGSLVGQVVGSNGIGVGGVFEGQGGDYTTTGAFGGKTSSTSSPTSPH